MYSRVTEFQSTSKTHCDMIIAFFQNVMIPRNLKNGMLSSEIYRVSDTEGFLMSTFKSKNDAPNQITMLKYKSMFAIPYFCMPIEKNIVRKKVTKSRSQAPPTVRKIRLLKFSVRKFQKIMSR